MAIYKKSITYPSFEGCVLKLTRKAIKENPKIEVARDAKLLCSSVIATLVYRIVVTANTIKNAADAVTLNLYILEATIKTIFLDIDVLLIDRAYKITERYKCRRDRAPKSSGREPRESLSTQAGITIFVSKVRRIIGMYSTFKRQSTLASVYIASFIEGYMCSLIRRGYRTNYGGYRTRFTLRQLALSIKEEHEWKGWIMGGGVKIDIKDEYNEKNPERSIPNTQTLTVSPNSRETCSYFTDSLIEYVTHLPRTRSEARQKMLLGNECIRHLARCAGVRRVKRGSKGFYVVTNIIIIKFLRSIVKRARAIQLADQTKTCMQRHVETALSLSGYAVLLNSRKCPKIYHKIRYPRLKTEVYYQTNSNGLFLSCARIQRMIKWLMIQSDEKFTATVLTYKPSKGVFTSLSTISVQKECYQQLQLVVENYLLNIFKSALQIASLSNPHSNTVKGIHLAAAAAVINER